MAEMNPQTPQKSTGKLKQMLSGKKSRRWIVLCVAAVAVIGGAAAFMSRAKAKVAKVETTYTAAGVEKRSITNPSPAAAPCSPPIPTPLPRWCPARSSATPLKRGIW